MKCSHLVGGPGIKQESCFQGPSSQQPGCQLAGHTTSHILKLQGSFCLAHFLGVGKSVCRSVLEFTDHPGSFSDIQQKCQSESYE